MFSLLYARHSNKFIAWVSLIVKRPLKKETVIISRGREREKELTKVFQVVSGRVKMQTQRVSLELISLTISDAINELETDREL